MADWRDELVEISGCELCDDDGVRLNAIGKCDHIDYGPIAKRGIALVLAAIEEAKSCSR